MHIHDIISLQENDCLETNVLLSNEMVTNYDQNSHQIRF